MILAWLINFSQLTSVIGLMLCSRPDCHFLCQVRKCLTSSKKIQAVYRTSTTALLKSVANSNFDNKAEVFEEINLGLQGKFTDNSFIDTRPHDSRAKETRKARRMNHGFRYLYRGDSSDAEKSLNIKNMSSLEYLVQYGGYAEEEVHFMQKQFPPLSELDVLRHLRPKMRFLKETILQSEMLEDDQIISEDDGINQEDRNLLSMKQYYGSMEQSDWQHHSLPEKVRSSIPPQYFGARLEKTVAPRHAFLMYKNLAHGKSLLLSENKNDTSFNKEMKLNQTTAAATSTPTLWQEFLLSCRNSNSFAAFCSRLSSNKSKNGERKIIIAKEVEAFDMLFGRGLMAAARDELCQSNNTWPLQYVNITSAELINLLVRHGANPLERDNRGVSLIHWAAGSGNLGAVKILMQSFAHGNAKATENYTSALFLENERDGATPLHWAAAGSSARHFGIGGHPVVCQYLLSQCDIIEKSNNDNSPHRSKALTKRLVNTLTKDGNSALMWAAWSGSLDTVKLLIRNRADPNIVNRNGCNVAHWAASGGNVHVCEYLASTVGVDFTVPNYGGNTPLTHAVAFGRAKVIEWLQSRYSDNSNDDAIAKALALDFVEWTNGEDKQRQQILNLFQDML